MNFLEFAPSSLCPLLGFVKLEFNAKLFSQHKHMVADERSNLFLQTYGNHTGRLDIGGRTLVSISFSRSPAYFYAHETEGLQVYRTKRLIIDEHDNNFEILCLSQGGYFSFVIEKKASDEDFFFELGDEKFVLSNEQLMIVR